MTHENANRLKRGRGVVGRKLLVFVSFPDTRWGVLLIGTRTTWGFSDGKFHAEI
jgi:hypothetical protein